ncbi:MAG: hypothetical protein ACXW4B_10705 [Micavibrio sp.]
MGGHQKDADFKAFHALLDADISVPIAHATSGPGARDMYLVVNLEAVRNLDYVERLNTIFNKHATNIMEQSPEAQQHRDVILSAPSTLYALALVGANPYTAAALTPVNTVFLDLRNMNAIYNDFTNMSNSVSWQFTPKDENLLKRAFFIHENAHATLGLKEPGSDFVAAVTMLRESPDSRSAMNTFADFRAISIQNTGSNAKYGIECHDAIRHALALPPEQIASMTDEEMLGLAKYFDDMNAMNNNNDVTSPEQKAALTLAGEINERGGSTGNTPEIFQAALTQSKAAFSPDSEEHKIIETIENSFNNLKEKHIAPKDRPAAASYNFAPQSPGPTS